MTEVAQPNPCKRWAHQSTLANGQDGSGSSDKALWIFGGRAITSLGQALDTWTNALLRLNLDEPFSRADPPIDLVYAQRNGSNAPPWVALGSLWTSSDGSQLYQMNGQVSDTPPADPGPNQLWQFDIHNLRWSNQSLHGDSISGVAEGASALAPGAGENGEAVLYHFGGHIDRFTTPNWNAPRVFLSSMTALTMGDMTIKNMTTFATKGSSGTSNSSASSADTPPLLRADSTLTYVPNLGTDNKGILVSIGGGNQFQMLESSVLDVFDIGAGAFVKQATQGDIMTPRVNHCAARGSAIVNGVEQHQIFVYGGHPANRTTQLQEGQSSDLYVLTLPSYTWTFVGSNLTSQPVPRAGHTCDLIGNQMLVVGGYIGEEILCDMPGIYILNTTSLEWVSDYVPGQLYTTPSLLSNITGGIASSNSTGGSGWQGPNEAYTATVTVAGSQSTSTSNPTNGDLHTSGSSNRLGPILGGVAGGLALAFVVAFLVHFFAKKQRRQKTNAFSARFFGTAQDREWLEDDVDIDASSFRGMAYSNSRRPASFAAVPMIPVTSPTRSQHRQTESLGSDSSWLAKLESER